MNIQEINLNDIYKKLYEIPKEKFVDINNFIDSIIKKNSKVKEQSNYQNRVKILSFAGIWEEMTEDEFNNFMKDIKGRRKRLFSGRRHEASFN